ncbi:hypothetical protein HQ529_01905 [Candidatus Woesearchaeota archaeon]|nr:hypothetical protein [Candidatus Woesearchaeota archaeon]
MAFIWDPMYAVNLVLCVIILVLGIWGYKKSGNKTELFVGVAFGLFGVSHLATLFGYKAMLQNFLIVIRTVAYLLVVYALYKVAFKK